MIHFNALKTLSASLVLSLGIASAASHPASAQDVRFHVLAFSSTDVERDHVMFGDQAIDFFSKAAVKDHFEFKVTHDWDDMNEANLGKYQVVLLARRVPAHAGTADSIRALHGERGRLARFPYRCLQR